MGPVLAVVIAGVVAALQVGKAAVAIPLLQAELGLDLGAVAWLAAIFPLLGVFGGVPAGSAVTAYGDRRILVLGLAIIAIGSAAGAAAPSYALLLGSRVLEGLGFLFIVVAAPTLLRRITVERRRNQVLAFWSCFIPIGMSLALFVGPLFPGWRDLWWTGAVLAALAAIIVQSTVPATPVAVPTSWQQLAADVGATVRSRRPLWLAACFGLYTVMYYAVFSFLPVLLMQRMDVSHRTAGVMSAVAVAANISGNLLAGKLLARGVGRSTLVIIATVSMGCVGFGIYLPLLPHAPTFMLCVLFSAVAGLVPATLLSGATLLAPRASLVPVTVGIVMQGSNLGQLVGPAIVGNMVAARGWSAAAVIVGIAALLAAAVALRLRRHFAEPVVALMLCSALLMAASPSPAAAPLPTAESLARDMDPRVAATLRQIRGTGLQLLALRSYLRAGDTLGDRWSWTDAQIRAWPGSTEEQALLADIDLVRKAFEARNAGYTLFVNPDVRSLELQISRWNQNATVAAAARGFEAAVRDWWDANQRAAGSSESSSLELIVFVEGRYPQPTPTLAAPGLSRHGRMNAVDFQIRKGTTTVAGTDSSAIARQWITTGWKERLRVAVMTSGVRFRGPLEQPLEPWHYEYAADLSQMKVHASEQADQSDDDQVHGDDVVQ